jgi:hypothetical protein
MRVAGRIARGDRVEARHVDEARLHLPLGEQVLQHVGGAVVDVAAARRRGRRSRPWKIARHRGEPRRERRARGAALERGERRLEAVAVRVVVARVDVAVRVRAVGVALEVVERWIGGVTAPVAGSTPWPAWTAIVSKRRFLRSFIVRLPLRASLCRGARILADADGCETAIR